MEQINESKAPVTDVDVMKALVDLARVQGENIESMIARIENLETRLEKLKSEFTKY
jgi:hypothetical protein